MKLNSINKTVAISIVTWNNEGEIRECLGSMNNLPDNWQIWVVDNNSADKTVEIIKDEFPNVNLIVNKDNVGFAAANNQVIAATTTDYVLLLNPDTESDYENLAKLLTIIDKNPKIGVIGAQLHDGKGEIQVICEHFPYPWRNFINALGLYRFFSAKWRSEKLLGSFFDHKTERPVEWIVGACLLARREAIEKAGNVPEDYFMFAEAMHWCYLMWQHDYEVWFTAEARVLHKKNRSARQLPPMWRVEKSILCKYVFCFGEFGFFKTKFIEISDYLSLTFGIWRLMFRNPEPPESIGWKMSREVIWNAIWMDAKTTSNKQLEKF